jgi:hypothetical protein
MIALLSMWLPLQKSSCGAMLINTPEADVVRNRGSLGGTELAALFHHDSRTERRHDHLTIPAMHHSEVGGAREEWVEITRRTVLEKKNRTIGLRRTRARETQEQENAEDQTS